MAADRLHRAIFLAVILPWILWSSARLARLVRRHGLHDVIEHMTRARAFPWRRLQDPRAVSRSVAIVSPLLPPFSLGPCLKRSLLSMDLLSRAGARPELHLGMVRDDEQRAFHVWLSGDRVPGDGRETGYSEIWRWPAEAGSWCNGRVQDWGIG